MNTINFDDNNKKIYFCGIGGISMSGLAELIHHRGFEVCGSDIKSSDITTHLESLGIKIYIGQKAENVTNDIDLFVNTAAVKKDNPEMKVAEIYNIPIMERSEFLGYIMKNYKYPVGISGTHGKTTTTSMLSQILLEADKDPTISVGGILDSIHGNVRIGTSEYFIVESCEYCDSFLKFFPYIGVILNIEADHLDYFKDINQIRTSFTKFAQLVPKDGAVIINGDIENVDEIISQLDCRVITFGTDKNKVMWTASNIIYNTKGIGTFDIIYKNNFVGKVTLGVPGIHNIYNALAACATAYTQGINMEYIIKGLHAFSGTHRRFEYKGIINGFTIIDDYAHHPTEIKATLEVADNYEHNKLWCVFQPHTYTRTKTLLEDFSKSFDNVDKIIVTDIYAARENNTVGIHAEDLVEKIKSRGKDAQYIGQFSDVEKYIIENCKQDDLLITMGAGDVYIIGDELINKKLSTISTELSTDSKVISVNN